MKTLVLILTKIYPSIWQVISNSNLLAEKRVKMKQVVEIQEKTDSYLSPAYLSKNSTEV